MDLAFVAASNMTVNLVGGGLFVLGAVLLVTTISLLRGATVDHEVLAPLEVMADRKFTRADDDGRSQLLNEFRPHDAEMVDSTVAVMPLVREPVSEPVRPWRDPFPHDDDAVDIVPAAPPIIDPLLQQHRKER